MGARTKIYVPRRDVDNEILEDKGLNLLKKNGFLLIIGPEGSGKSTTAEFIGGRLSKDNIVFRIIPTPEMRPGFRVNISQTFEGHIVDLFVSTNTLGLEERLFEVFLSIAKLSKIDFEQLKKDSKFINVLEKIFISLMGNKLDELKDALISFSFFLPGFARGKINKKTLVAVADSIKDLLGDLKGSSLVSGTFLVKSMSSLSAISTALTLILVMVNFLELREMREIEGDLGKSLLEKFEELLVNELRERKRGLVVIIDDITDAKHGTGKAYDLFLDFAKVAYQSGLLVVIVRRLSFLDNNELDKFSSGKSTPLEILAGREDYFPESWIYIPYPDSDEFSEIIRVNWSFVLSERKRRNLKEILTDRDLEKWFLKTGGNIKVALELMRLVDVEELSDISEEISEWRRQVKLYARIFKELKDKNDFRFPLLFGILSLDEIERFYKTLGIQGDILDLEEAYEYGWGIKKFMTERLGEKSFVVYNLDPENLWLRRILFILEDAGEVATKRKIAKYRMALLEGLTEKVKKNGIVSERMVLMAIFNLERLNTLGKLRDEDLLYWMTIALNILSLEPPRELLERAINVAINRNDLLALGFLDALLGHLRGVYPDEDLLESIIYRLERVPPKDFVEEAFLIRLRAEILFILYSNAPYLRRKKLLKYTIQSRLLREYKKLEERAIKLPHPYSSFILQRVLFWEAEILRSLGRREEALNVLERAEELLSRSLEDLEEVPKEFVSLYTESIKKSYKVTLLSELVRVLTKKAFILTELGRLEEAEKVANKCVRIATHEGPGHDQVSAREILLWIKVLKEGPSKNSLEEALRLLREAEESLSLSTELKMKLCIEYTLLSVILPPPQEWDIMTTSCFFSQFFSGGSVQGCNLEVPKCFGSLRDPLRALVAGTLLLPVLMEDGLELMKGTTNELLEALFKLNLRIGLVKLSSSEMLGSEDSVLGLYSLTISRLAKWIWNNPSKLENSREFVLNLLKEFIENGKIVAKTDFEKQLLEDIEEAIGKDSETFRRAIIKLVYYLIPKAIAVAIKLPKIRYVIPFGNWM